MIVALEIIGIVLAVMWVTGVLYIITKGKVFRWFYHDILEWHLPNDNLSVCKFCGKDIQQDSQGNWY